MALGASKVRLVRQLLTESVLLSVGGGVTRAAEVRIDGPVLLFTALVSVATGLLFGLAPAFSSSRQVSEALRQGGGRTTASRGRQRLRAGLVVAQVTISFMLLIGAGLMIRSFLKLLRENPGFRPDHILTLRLSPNFSRYTRAEQLRMLRESILRRIPAVGGVESAALASNFPFNPRGIANGPGDTSFEIEGKPVSKSELAPRVDVTIVSADYFQTIRQPLTQGRVFTEHDNDKALLVAVINQTMARHPGQARIPLASESPSTMASIGSPSSALLQTRRNMGSIVPWAMNSTRPSPKVVSLEI